jgi:hypothetical protein
MQSQNPVAVVRVKAIGNSNSVPSAALYMKTTRIEAEPSNRHTPITKQKKSPDNQNSHKQ